jgi:hypothetical protein
MAKPRHSMHCTPQACVNTCEAYLNSCAHRLPSGLQWASQGCKHSTVENMPRKQFLALDRARCAEEGCGKALGIICPDCGKVY